MKSTRRVFIKKTIQGAVAGCMFSQCPGWLRAESKNEDLSEVDQYVNNVSQEMTYCAFRCDSRCKWLIASLNHDEQVMQEMAENWSRLHPNQEIPKNQRFCYGCKPVDKPLSYIATACAVRACAIEKKLSSCAECETLATCDKDLWTLYPEHREYVLKIQKGM